MIMGEIGHMRVLLVYPLFPPSFWSFTEAIRLVGRKAMSPPLALVTVAALLPQNWEFRLVDRNVREISEEDWTWAEIVMLSAMIVQKEDLLQQVREAKRRGKRVAVGGPYPTAMPEECREADYLILDEGEVTLPQFLAALDRGERAGVFRANGQKPDVTLTPIPRFDLLDLNAYSEMSVQFSRGCPFSCEFCDIIVLYGRKPRTKTPSQMLGELQRLYDLGWRRSVFVVDDNFIGNKKNVKRFLSELQPWMVERDYPFSFTTEASIDLAQDQELMDLMVQCNFSAVFVGIETPDTQSLELTGKTQNNRHPLADSVTRLARSGLRVMAGFIIGFDAEEAGAGKRIFDFVEQTAIPTTSFSMLQALPGTALSQRLAEEGRLLEASSGDINQTTLMNFVPTRPLEQIAQEYVEAFWGLYDPLAYMERVFRQFMLLKDAPYPRRRVPTRLQPAILVAMVKIFWRQGIVRKTRWRFWQLLLRMYCVNRRGIKSYLSICAQEEHFIRYRQRVRDSIAAQLKSHPSQRHIPRTPSVAPPPLGGSKRAVARESKSHRAAV
jgi:radical SAM superfamily enzyme YgiQ (UPF0313 family)